VPGDREVVLEVTHPLLTAAPDGGSVTVTKATDGLVLRLVAGTTARIRWSPPPKPAAWERDPVVRVLLFAGEPTGAAAHEAKGVVQDDVVRFGGFPVGRYTVWIDGPPYAPLVLRDVALGEGETDLGQARPEKGATLRLRILPKEGEASPRIGVNLRKVGEPSYGRYVVSRGEDVVEVSGIGPGSFELSLVPQAAPLPRTLKETVESDGASLIERTLDLR
jgi:hypothetical protein